MVPLPWQHTWASGSSLRTELDCSAGVLRGLGAESFIAGIGPAVLFGSLGAPGHLRAGISATYLGRTELGERDFGFPLQFTSYVGFEIEVGRHLEFGYRFQHMSNAGLGSHNPGLNLHALSLTYRF